MGVLPGFNVPSVVDSPGSSPVFQVPVVVDSTGSGSAISVPMSPGTRIVMPLSSGTANINLPGSFPGREDIASPD